MIVFLGFITSASPASSEAVANFTGDVVSRLVLRGPAGAVAEIELVVDVGARQFWSIRCTRHNRNLSACASLRPGDFADVDGVLRVDPFSRLVWLSPVRRRE